VRESFDSSFITSPIWRTTLGELVIAGTIKIIVPLITALVLGTFSVLVMDLDPVVSILGMDDILKVSCTLTLVAVIQGV
jgi:hypothetical protein